MQSAKGECECVPRHGRTISRTIGNRRKFYRDIEEQCYQKLKWISVLRGSTELDYPGDSNVF